MNVELTLENYIHHISHICNETTHDTEICPDKDLWFGCHAYRCRTDIIRRNLENLIRNYQNGTFHNKQAKVNLTKRKCPEQVSEHLKSNTSEEKKYFKDFAGEINYNKDMTDEQTKQLETLLYEFKDLFAFDPSQIGECNVLQYTLDTGNAKPIKRSPYKYSVSQREEINRQVQKWLDLGIVTPSKSAWGSPVILVEKKSLDENGKPETRICVDIRSINAVTKSDIYPLPAVRDVLDALNGSVYFTILDENSGFFQIVVAPEDREKLAFLTQDGLYEFLRMPFGTKNGPAVFQRVMDIVLAGLKWKVCVVYLDDTVVCGKTFEIHLENLRQVLERLRDSGLTLNPKKCSFCQTSIKFLGHMVSSAGISTDPEKIKAIVNFPRPKTLTDVRSFVGLASYY